MKTKSNDYNNRYICLNIFILFTAIYLLTISGSFFQADISILRYDVAESIAERLDLTVRDGFGLKGADGRDYSWIGLGSALVSVPFYLIGKILGSPEAMISLVNPVFTSLTAVLLFIFVNSLGYTKRVSLIVTMFFGLGTIAWPQSKQPFDHPVETFFVLLSLFQCHQFANHRRVVNIVLSGAAAGLAFLTRPTTILLIPALIVLTLESRRRKCGNQKIGSYLAKTAIQFNLGFLPLVGISLWYNHYRFGSIFETGYSLIASLLGLDFFTGTSLLTGLSGLMISPGKGFFFYSPVAIFFFLSIRSFYKRQPSLAAAFILLISSYLLFISKNIYWHGDWTWGPRYLLAITPLFIIPIAELANSLSSRNRATRVSFYLIISISILIQISGVMVDFRKYFHNLVTVEKVSFIVSTADGAPSVAEPPVETYFNLDKSPILAQFQYIIEIGENLPVYKEYFIQKNPTISKQSMGSPVLYLYDFWWVYMFLINENLSALLVTAMLLFLSAYSTWKLFDETKGTDGYN